MLPSRPPLTRQEFEAEFPEYSIALDGFVRGAPWLDTKGRRACFNHHEDVPEFETLATAPQVLLHARMGLPQLFRRHGSIYVIICAHDCDQDVCLADWILRNLHIASVHMNPRLNKLVGIVGSLDATAGAYPYPEDLPILAEIDWVMEPYIRARRNGELQKKDPDTYVSIIDDVGRRINQFLFETPGKLLPSDGEEPFRVHHDGRGWKLVEELSLTARTLLFRRGISAFVSVQPRRQDGRWAYSVIRASPYVPFDLPEIFRRLNAADDGGQPWGGGENRGGCQRGNGSSLAPETVAKIVDDIPPLF